MRQIRMFTGIGGKDQHDIALERYIGYERIYAGTKLSRIVRRVRKDWKRDYRKIYYYLTPIKQENNNLGIHKLYSPELLDELVKYEPRKKYKDITIEEIEQALYDIFIKPKHEI